MIRRLRGILWGSWLLPVHEFHLNVRRANSDVFFV